MSTTLPASSIRGLAISSEMNLVFPVFCGRKWSFHLKLCWGNLQAHSCINSKNPGLCQSDLSLALAMTPSIVFYIALLVLSSHAMRREALLCKSPDLLPFLLSLCDHHCPTRQNKWLPLKVSCCWTDLSVLPHNPGTPGKYLKMGFKVPSLNKSKHFGVQQGLMISSCLTDRLWIVENAGSNNWPWE